MTDIREVAEATVKAFNSPEISEARMYRLIHREMALYVDANQLQVLNWIFDRTICYGKACEVIPASHFLHGIWSGDTCLHPPIKMSRASLYRALAELIENVFIIKGKAHRTGSVTYAINPAWVASLTMRQTSLTQRLASMPVRLYNKEDNNKKDLEQVARTHTRSANTDPEDDMATAKELLLATVQGAVVKGEAARSKKKKKRNASGLMAIWQDAFREHYPDDTCFVWREYEQAAFRRALSRGVPETATEQFIEFCVQHFQHVLNTKLAWMKSKPSVPDVGFVTKHIDKFYQSFQDDRDPNRKLKRRISEADEQPTRKPRKPDNEETKELEKLRRENAALRQVNQKLHGDKRRRIKKLIRPGKVEDPEFGSFDD